MVTKVGSKKTDCVRWAVVLLVALFAASCEIPLSPSASDGLKLSFVIAGQGPSAGSVRTVSERLLLPNVTTVTASLTLLTEPHTVLSKSSALVSGSTKVTLNFGKVAEGLYTVRAQGVDASGTVQFQQSSTLNLTQATTAMTLNLVPAFSSGTTSLASGQTVSGMIAAGQALSWSIPGNSLIAGSYILKLVADASVLVYPQNSDGSLIASTTNSGSWTVPVANSSSSFLTLYNSGTVAQPYQFAVNQQVNGTMNIVNPPNNPVTITGSAVAFIGIATKLSAGYTGTASSYTWYFDGVSKGTGATQMFTPSASDFGNHVLMLVVTDVSGLSYSTSVAMNVSSLPGLAGEWLFTGNTNDTSGNGNTGTLSGTTLPVPAADRFGNAAHAYSFNQAGAIVLTSLPLTTSGGYGTPKNYTISVWINTTAASVTNGQYIFAQVNSLYSGYYDNPAVKLTNVNVPAHFLFPLPAGTQHELDGITAVPANVWTHLVTTRTAGDRKLYINDVLVAEDAVNDDTYSATATSTWLTNGYNYITFAQSAIDMAVIGNAFSSGASWGFQGSIDDLRIYNQELTATQINALYHEGGY